MLPRSARTQLVAPARQRLEGLRRPAMSPTLPLTRGAWDTVLIDAHLDATASFLSRDLSVLASADALTHRDLSSAVDRLLTAVSEMHENAWYLGAYQPSGTEPGHASLRDDPTRLLAAGSKGRSLRRSTTPASTPASPGSTCRSSAAWSSARPSTVPPGPPPCARLRRLDRRTHRAIRLPLRTSRIRALSRRSFTGRRARRPIA